MIKRVPSFVPAGQSTQLVVGATPETDFEIMQVANTFYRDYKLKRVYYSGYIPINNTHNLLPQIGSAPPLLRENRLYQTDWLLRFYDFKLEELLSPAHQQLDLAVDPKLSWALRNPQFFPVDINRADLKEIIRVPGIGRQSAMKIINARKFGRLHAYQLQKMGMAFNRAKHFITYADAPFVLGAPSMDTIEHTIPSESASKYAVKVHTHQLTLF